jgi:hypothetical protein
MFRVSRGNTFCKAVQQWIGAILIAAGLAVSAHGQDHTILFNTSASGVSAAITNWGLDTCWPSYDNMLRGLIYMGTNHVNVVRVGFTVDAPLTNNDISPNDKSILLTCANLASMATAATRWDMNELTGVDPWYQSGVNTVYADRWAAAIEACQHYYNRSIWSVEGFNEPDYTVNHEGSPQNLYDIFGYLQASTNFPGTLMAGGSTLNEDNALSWFTPISARASIATTHCLAGSAASYVNFLQNAGGSTVLRMNPELHNSVEAMIGANYGLKAGIWWGTAELARGSFVQACQGQRLGYAEDLGKWTAATIYRGTNGAVQAFVGASERMATTTSYQFFSKDRDVFYNGDGPRRDYTVTIPGGSGYMTADQRNAELVVNVAWGSDIQSAINGRYLIVNRNSGKVLEVPGGSAANGVQLDQTTYTGALNQKWDVSPLPSTMGGDYSYFTIRAAHDGVTADLNGFSYANGAAIQQWNGGTNTAEQWYFQYTTNGYFKIRSRWSNKVIGVNGASLNNGAVIVQWDDTGTLDQQWRLIPATVASYDFVAPSAPTQLSATPNAVSIQLTWQTNSEPDFASYTVLRGTNFGGPYEIAARGLTTNSFTDKFANLPRNYYYVVRAVDRSLNTSPNSAPVFAMPTGNPALIAKYSFDANFGDVSANANDPIATNGAPSLATGKYSSAVNFNGTDQNLMLPANMLASVTNFTFAGWVYWNGGGAWQRIFDFGNNTTEYMFLTPNSGSGTLRFAITTNGNGGEQIIQTSPLPTGQWQHVAITRNGTTLKLFTNGVLAATSTATIAPAIFNPALNYLGKSQWPDPPFNGRLDEVYIYNYALSDTEISRLANNVPPPPSEPTTLVTTVAGGALNISWPLNYLGCRLESNSVGITATDSWFTVPNSAGTNAMHLPIDLNQAKVFFRLSYP